MELKKYFMNDNIILLGIDGGGSKVRCLAADLNGNILGLGINGPVNELFTERREIINNISEAVSDSVGKINKAKVKLAFCGAPTSEELLREGIQKVLDVEQVINRGELFISLVGSFLIDFGVVVIAGTGSFAGGKNPQGKVFSCGGWGPFIGDEGSGYWIGIRAINAISKATDKRLPRTTLTEKILEYFNIGHIGELVPYIYKNKPSRYQIAQISKIVDSSAEEGDKIAQEILEDAGRELALLTKTVIRELDYQNAKIAKVGGVFTSKSRFINEIFDREVKIEYPNVDITFPIFPPVVGALILAFRHLKLKEDKVLENVKEFFRRINYV